MKKLISILLVICMLAAATAFAATEKVGVTMAAQEGLDFTLMENRHTLDDEDVRNRMQWAYQTIHDTDHFSEMESVNHENGIAQDINQELVEMGADLTAYDYLIYDSFELQLQDAYADQLGNGNTLEVNFDLNLDREVKLVVLLSNNEESWQCLDHENVNQNADGTAAVRFSELGTVLFLIDVKHQPASAGAEPDSNFTPSVSGKPAPDVVPPSGADPDIIARIYNENDELISEVPDEGWLVITPVSRRDTAEDKEVRERLEWAYNQIQTTPRLGDLDDEAGDGIGDEIDKVLDKTGFDDLDSDDMIVRDLFDATLYGTEYVDALNHHEAEFPANYIKLRCLENHDQPRIAGRIHDPIALSNWNAFMFFQKGTPMIYAGQEFCDQNQPSLFDIDRINWSGRDISAELAALAAFKKAHYPENAWFSAEADDEKHVVTARCGNAATCLLGVFSLRGSRELIQTDIPDGVYENLLCGESLEVKTGVIITGRPLVLKVR